MFIVVSQHQMPLCAAEQLFWQSVSAEHVALQVLPLPPPLLDELVFPPPDDELV